MKQPQRSVLLVGPKVPPYGGMALQGKLMQELMNAEGISADFLASNLPFPPAIQFMDKLRGVRPFLRSMVFCWQLWNRLVDTSLAEARKSGKATIISNV